MSRRANNLPESNYPLVCVQRFQSLKCDVNTRQLDELAKYISYVEAASGDKPTEGEVVGAALTELFKEHRPLARPWCLESRPHDRLIEPLYDSRERVIQATRRSLSLLARGQRTACGELLASSFGINPAPEDRQ